MTSTNKSTSVSTPVGFKFVCILSLIASIVVICGTSWIIGTRNSNAIEQFNSTRPTQRTKVLTRLNNRKPGGSGASVLQNDYEKLKMNTLKQWEAKAKPVLLGCSVVACFAAFIQSIVSLMGIFTCSLKVQTKIKCWLIVHFILFLIFVLVILTTFITNMNHEKRQTWNMKVENLERSAVRSKVDKGDEVAKLRSYLFVGSIVFYIIVSIDLACILILFFIVIWLMKEGQGYKYQNV